MCEFRLSDKIFSFELLILITDMTISVSQLFEKFDDSGDIVSVKIMPEWLTITQCYSNSGFDLKPTNIHYFRSM